MGEFYPPSPFFGRSSLYSRRQVSMIAWACATLVNPVLVQALVAEPAIERFDVRVLRRFAGRDQAERDPACMRPRQHGAPAELQSVVGP
jgi:hypothetical protein